MAMLPRIAMHTESLQKQFPTVYREFFARCQKVASASNSFLWTGEFAGFYGGLTVSQKLPIRSYVGLETTFDKQVAVEREYQTFQADQQNFTTAVADDRLCDQLKQYLTQTLSTRQDFTGVRVHLLTEIPLGHSLGSNGAIAAALSLLLADTVDFESTLQIARDILSLSQAGHSSGVSAYMALTQIEVPVVFFSHREEYFAKPITDLVETHQTETNNTNNQPIWPIDFGLIYSGGGANAESVILANSQTIKELDASGHRLDGMLGGQQQLNFQQTYIDMLNMTSSLMVMALGDLFAQGAKNQLLEQLFNSLNQYQNLLHMVHVASGSTDLIYSRLHQVASKQINDVGSGVKISGIGRGGAVLFAMPYGVHRQAVVDLVTELRQSTGRSIWLDYASWIDGIGGQPGLIEQDLESSIRSKFVEHDAVALCLMHRGTLRQEMVTGERLAEYVKELDLLVDNTTGKLMIAGQPVTSKELPSQKATVSVIASLLQRPDLRLCNDELPTSYASSRYDLQGKIVLPLIKHIKERTGRDLQLTIRGGMYDDYELTLEASNIIIGVIDKKF